MPDRGIDSVRTRALTDGGEAMRTHSGGSLDDEELVREGGVFVSRNGGREVGPEGDDRAPGDYVEDPGADDGVPGTRDDLPYDLGVDITPAADQLVDEISRRSSTRQETAPAD
jgi:hypothetical protein